MIVPTIPEIQSLVGPLIGLILLILKGIKRIAPRVKALGRKKPLKRRRSPSKTGRTRRVGRKPEPTGRGRRKSNPLRRRDQRALLEMPSSRDG